MAHIRHMNVYILNNYKFEREILQAAKRDSREGRKRLIHKTIKREKINKRERIGGL